MNLMKINNIIQEELKKVLNESYVMEHENFIFRQEIKNSSFYNYETFSKDFDVDVSESDIFITWHIAFWLNDFGVEHFIVEADNVDGTYKLVLLNRQTDETEQESDKNISDFQWKFKVDEANLRLGSTLYVESLDFDFKTKVCKVTFFDSENY
jgi:hypothetical protein